MRQPVYPPSLPSSLHPSLLPSLPSLPSSLACLQGYLFKCGPLALEKVHHYAYQLFDAIDFLHHKLKIVHCDIKREFVNDNNSHKIQILKVNRTSVGWV